MSNHNDLVALMEDYVANSEKFDSGNKAAGTRARKALSELAKAGKERRKEIQAIKNGD